MSSVFKRAIKVEATVSTDSGCVELIPEDYDAINVNSSEVLVDSFETVEGNIGE